MAQHKLTRQALCLSLVLSLSACAGTTVPSGTSLDAAAVCINSVTTARKAATALLRAEKITLERDRQIQDALNTSAEGCSLLATQGVAP